MTGAAVYLLLGLSLLLAIVLPQVTRRIALSPPMVLVALGMLIGLLPLPEGVSLEPQAHRELITHVTEFTVLVSLMGVGLAIERAAGPAVLAVVAHLVAGVAAARASRCRSPSSASPSSAGGSPASRPRSRCCSAPCSPRPTRCWPPTSRSASRSPRTSTRTRSSTRRPGRRHPLLPHRRGRDQRRAGVPVRAPGPAPAGRRLHVPRRRRVDRLVPRRQDRRSASPSAWRPAGCWAARPSAPAPTPCAWPTTASRCWRWPRCWRRTAPRSWSAATASWPSSPARCACGPRSAATPTTARCTASSSGSSG